MSRLKLYLLERNDTMDYDEYDSFVIAAESPEKAHQLAVDTHWRESKYFTPWPKEFSSIDVTVIGTAAAVYDDTTIILGSFNAG